jgi:hypothetical protein
LLPCESSSRLFQVLLFQVPSKLSTVSKKSRPHPFKFDQQAVSVGRVMP